VIPPRGWPSLRLVRLDLVGPLDSWVGELALDRENEDRPLRELRENGELRRRRRPGSCSGLSWEFMGGSLVPSPGLCETCQLGREDNELLKGACHATS